MPSERREYSSISVQFPVWLRTLPDGECPSLYYEYTAFAHDSLANPLNSGLPEAVTAFLMEMNNKLDSILGLLSIEELRQAFPIEARCTEVGGSGLTLSTGVPFKNDTYAEAVLVLCRIPLRLAGAIGKLSPAAPEESTAAPGEALWRLNFTRIREQDLETVIRFVIQEERRIIRQKKWD